MAMETTRDTQQPAGQVKVLEFCQVAPPPGSVSEKSLPLTFFDLLWLPLPPPQRLYFYKFPHSNTTHFTNSILPCIKHSLSLILQYYYPLAGNLVWPLESEKPMIRYLDGDSVSLTVAESEDDFHHLSGDHAKDANQSHSLVPHLQVTGEVVPILALQVTLFPNSGICIGITAHHSAVDGKVATQFMKSWACVCKLGETSFLTTEMLPFYDRTVIKDPSGLETIYLKDLVKFFESDLDSESKYRKLKVMDIGVPPNMVRATFEFNQADVAKLKKQVLPFHMSTFVVTSAFVWECLVKSGGEVCKNNVSFWINIDYRARLDPPIPSNYFGNCIGGVMAVGERNNLVGQNGIAAKLIQEAIKGLEINGLFCNAESAISSILSLNKQTSAAAGSPRFKVYETDFGWGKPEKVEMISIDRTGAVSFAESRKGDGGVEIGLVLDKDQMDAFASAYINGLNGL